MNKLPDSVALKLLAQGNTAEIYDYPAELGDGTMVRSHGDLSASDKPPVSGKILKLFRENFPPEPILAEYEKSRLISRELDNVPRVYDLITCQNRRGIVYEKICGPSMIQALLRAPHKLKRTSQNLAEIHFALHSRDMHLNSSAKTNPTNQAALIPVKDKLAADIDAVSVLTSVEKSRLKSYLRSLTDGDSLLHFDFHPGNILLRPENPPAPSSRSVTHPARPSSITPVIIDWMTACVGDPCADVARTCLLLRYGELAHANPLVRRAAHLFSGRIGNIYLATYLDLSRLTPADVEKWLLPVAAARLREWVTPHEQKRLLSFIHETLSQQS